MAYSTISKPSLHFNTKTYTGTGADNNAITGVGFQPDWTWLKSRSVAEGHYLQDAVRGATKHLHSQNTDAEATQSNALKSFNSDGFTVGDEGDINTNNSTNVSWNWKANGQGSSNTDGSINTTYTSVNTTAGFSISQYTGTGSAATVGHGLGAVPRLIIIKKLNSSTGADWYVYHASNGNNSKIWLNQTSAKGTGTHMNNTTPTSSVFSIGTPTEVNNSGDTYIAYCFAEKKGYSKFGSYIGNGNANGTFIYTGFKPAFLIVKRTNSSGDDWNMWDSTRRTFNLTTLNLKPNASNAEGTADNHGFDLLSNGFKPRGSIDATNGSNSTYIYIAFAKEPLVANVGAGIPATAR